MPNYRRAITNGGTYFFTVVTFHRQAILIDANSRTALRDAINATRDVLPFTIDAWVLLPDHLHCIWTLPGGDHDYSKRWGLIKAHFSKRMKPSLHKNELMKHSKHKHRESTIWQRRFWEHRIRDEHDYQTHMDYIHYNPVKHSLVKAVCDWQYSSFHRCVKEGLYPGHWGTDFRVSGNIDYGE